MRIFSFLYAIFLIILRLSCYSLTAQSSPTLNLSAIWHTNDTSIITRETNLATFSCGFTCVETICSYSESKENLFFSVYINGPYGYGPKVVWSANRDYPVGSNATLEFSASGELVLKDGDGRLVWTTDTAGKSVVGVNLTDIGNLVLFDDQNAVVWQSFDHPTDCWLPGQRLYEGQKLKSSVSVTNLSEGVYSLQVTDKGLVAYIESNPPQVYDSILSLNPYLNHTDTHTGRRYVRYFNSSLSLYFNSKEPSKPDDIFSLITGSVSSDPATYNIPNASSAQYMKLMPGGQLQVFAWQQDSEKWALLIEIIDASTYDPCPYPLMCGRNSLCSSNQQCGCPRFEYFRPVNDSQPNLGCSEITPLTCNSTQDQGFITLENVKYFTLDPDMAGVHMDICKKTCLNNCSCKAAFFRYDSNASSGDCYLTSELFTMQTVDPLYHNYSAFIKVQNVTSPPLARRNATAKGSTNRESRKVARVVGSTIGSFILLLVVGIGLITYVVYKRKRDAEMEEEYLDEVPGMPTRFSYDELTIATQNFSKKLGEGGFGSVFEGTLVDGSKIAVKCLEGLSHIKKSFLTEVQSIGSIHHVNLVRLRGFCTFKSQRFLVYDFMSNGSLDRWIYHGNLKQALEWKCRKKIILDIAKGLAYLHEECRQKIIHLDIKPQNILLDDEFNAKVSDFGLSKLMDRNQSQVMTTMRGTLGYMAPEWLSAVITEKVDVYSFGIVLLEIVCGRKNFDRSQPEERWHLLRVFQNCCEQETLLDIVDMQIEDMHIHGTEVVEMMKLASWCLQTDYTRRPSMSTVVNVLQGGMNVESNLDYNFTDPRLQKTNSQDTNLTPLLPSVLSGPR